MIWWKVKKLMPRGSTQVQTADREAAKRRHDCRLKKSAYLNSPSTARFSTIAPVMTALLRVAANCRAANQFTRIEPTSSETNAGFQ